MTARYYTNEDGTVDEATKEAVLAPMARFVPLRRVGRTADIAYCVLYLASDASSFVTGQMISPNGGVSMSDGAPVSRRPEPDARRRAA